MVFLGIQAHKKTKFCTVKPRVTGSAKVSGFILSKPTVISTTHFSELIYLKNDEEREQQNSAGKGKFHPVFGFSLELNIYQLWKMQHPKLRVKVSFLQILTIVFFESRPRTRPRLK